MKNFKAIITMFVLILLSCQLQAQVSGGIFFQAVARDNFSNPAKDRKIYLQSSIIQSTANGTKVLIEEHQTTTDAAGIFSISIGNGTRVGGTASGLANIDWANGPFYLNLKVAITPVAADARWNYSNEWIDMGTTNFGAVPYALYSLNTGGISQKLNIADSSKYVTPTMLSAKTFDTTSLSNRINSKLDTTKLGVANGIATLNSSGIIPSNQLPPVTFSSTSVVASDADMTALSTAIVGSIAIRTDVSKNYVLSALPASNLSNWIELLTPGAPVQTVNGYSGSVNLAKSDIGLNNVDNTNDVSKPVSNLTQAALNLKLDANKVGAANGTASLNAAGKIPTDQIPAISFSSVKVLSSQAAMLGLSSAVVGSVVIRTDVNKNFVLAASDPSVLANWIELLTPAPPVQSVNGYAGNVSLVKGDLGLGNVENTSDANKAISTATQNALNLKANSTDVNTALALKAPIASPTFTGTVTTSAMNTGAISATSITSPVLASTPINLSYTGTNINWNTGLGLNAAITLTQNSTLNFTSLPVSGTNGTLVITQDATGGRTLTLPSTTNKILGSTSTTSIPLSSGAGVKDILNFYYDGTSFYWNIGQGYGQNTIPATTNLQLGVTGTLQVSNGGTGGTIFNGLIKGNGTSAMTTAMASVDYQAPITLTTTGVGSATFSGSVLNIPTPSSNSAAINAGTLTGTTLATNVVNSSLTGVGTITSGTWSGTTIGVANGGTGASNAVGARTNLGLGNVENTALSTWTGSSNLTTVGSLSAAGKAFWFQDLILGYGTTFGTISTDAADGSKYISFLPKYGVESTRLWPSGNVTIQHGGAYTDNGYTLDVQGNSIAKSYKMTVPAAITATATTNIDLSTGNMFKVNLGANITSLTFSNAIPGTYIIEFIQDGTGNRTLIFPAAWKWSGGTTPTITSAANKIDIVTVIYDGTTYFASIVQNF